MFNFDLNVILPALAISSVVLLIAVKIYQKIRIKFPIKVNCWFCNGNTSVPYNSSNSWYCPHCDQYNGFSTDGSYNRLLQEQYHENLNCGSWCTKVKGVSTASNGLCRFCNINLELKIQQLAQFVPFNKENYDEEIQQYSHQLERVYRLCSRCENVLNKTLREKQERFLTNRNFSFLNTVDHSSLKAEQNEKHSLYLSLTAVISAGLLVSVMPYDWMSHMIDKYPPPQYISQLLSLAQEYLPRSTMSVAVLTLGVLVQLFDCVHMRNLTSFVNLFLWVILLLLSQVPVHIEGLTSIIHMLASIVFFISSIVEHKQGKPKNIATVKPVQLHKLEAKSGKREWNANVAKVESVFKPVPLKSHVPDHTLSRTLTSDVHERTPDDFGFNKLNVSSGRVTRSQAKHFQTKLYGSHSTTDLFRPKSVNLSPPKLLLDKSSEYQVPVTRSSSQSSGFVSLSNQRDFDEYRTPSMIGDNIESVSQCGGNTLIPHQPPFISPNFFSHQYDMPFSRFQPYAIVHFTPQNFHNGYPCPPSYNSAFSLSSYNVSNKNVGREGWFQYLTNIFYPFLFLFLITSNTAILWKVFGEEYLRVNS